MNPNNLPGSLKIAILVQSMSDGASQAIINSLDDGEKEVVKNHLDQMGIISPDIAEKVAVEFEETARRAKSRKLFGGSGKDNEEKGEEYLKKMTTRSASLGAMLSLDSDKLYKLIKDEHPQTIAIIMIHIKTNIASNVLSRLPDQTKKEVALRIVSLDKVMAEMIEEVNFAFEDIIETMDSSISNATGGTDRVAEILNQTDEMSSEFILNEIEEDDPEMAAKIKQQMFVFEEGCN